MSMADKFMSKSQTREAKQAATPTGVYTVQCTEGTGGSNTAEATRVASLAKEFRLRQSGASSRYADLFATRRAAIVAAGGSHVMESYAVKFPARAAAGVLGRAEKLRACSRYFGETDEASEYMFECVERQYKAKNVAGGVYSTACCDGRQGGDAENARVSALGTAYRAGQLSESQKTQARYDASHEAIYGSTGCSFEEEEFVKFPKMSAAMRYSTGAYAASITGVSGAMSGAPMTVAEQIKGVNQDSFWPSNKIRAAIERKSAPWMPSPIKQYSAMSVAALEYGIAAQSSPFKEDKYSGWTPDWKPTSSVVAYGN